VSQAALIPRFVVHCFWMRCRHTETGLDPAAVHDAMEAHYDRDHQADLAALGYLAGIRVAAPKPRRRAGE
jgi:hypothetical protein